MNLARANKELGMLIGLVLAGIVFMLLSVLLVTSASGNVVRVESESFGSIVWDMFNFDGGLSPDAKNVNVLAGGKLAFAKPGIYMIAFGRDGCPWCVKLKPVWKQFACAKKKSQIESADHMKYNIVWIDVADPKNKSVGIANDIITVPAIKKFVVGDNGQIISKSDFTQDRTVQKLMEF